MEDNGRNYDVFAGQRRREIQEKRRNTSDKKLKGLRYTVGPKTSYRVK